VAGLLLVNNFFSLSHTLSTPLFVRRCIEGLRGGEGTRERADKSAGDGGKLDPTFGGVTGNGRPLETPILRVIVGLLRANVIGGPLNVTNAGAGCVVVGHGALRVLQ